MSSDSRTMMDEIHRRSGHSVVTSHHRETHSESGGHYGGHSAGASHHRETYSESGGHYVSSIIINLRQLQTDLHAQHQHDKHALNELNKNFQAFVDRVHWLQSENAKYLAAIADYRRHSSGISVSDIQSNEGYFAMRRDLTAIDNAKVDCQWDFELSHLQTAIYKQLIGIEEEWEGKRTSVLEGELKQSSSALIGLRSSYTEMQRRVESLYGECDDLFKQYLTLSHDWCLVKKQRHKERIHMETLKSYAAFYRNINSYAGRSVSFESAGVVEVRALDLEKIKKKIRYDFEVFYATLYSEMKASYEAKMVEIETEVREEAQYQSVDVVDYSVRIQTHQAEYEKVQHSLSHEREMLMKLEHTHSQLEAEFNSIHSQYAERLEVQAKDLQSVQESIMFMAFDVDEIRRSKADLESEIIVYRHLLEVYEIEHRGIIEHRPPVEHRPAVVHPIQTTGSETMRRLAVKSQKRGSIGIKVCAPNGTYISLVNHSTNKDIDISKWKLKRHIDSVTKLRYTIPDGVRLNRDSELRIYTKSGGGSTNESYNILVNHELTSWGVGSSIETILFNKDGEEEASYTQMI